LHQYVQWIGVNKNANSRINLIFVVNTSLILHFRSFYWRQRCFSCFFSRNSTR